MYVKFSPSEYVFRYSKGKVVAEGIGLSFFYWEKTTSACAVPMVNVDADFIFEEQTKDFQSITIQGQVTYRIVDYKKIVNLMDFSVDLKTKRLSSDPMPKLSKRIINISEVFVKTKVGQLPLKDAIQSGRDVANAILEELKSSEELKELGILISGFSIIKASSNKETGRALEAKTREDILNQADDAVYTRRNSSIEQERKVKENELNTEILVEEKKKQIRQTEIETRTMLVEKESALKKIEVEKKVERERIEIEAEAEKEKIKILNELEIEKMRKELAELKLENAKKDADAEAYRISAVMEAYSKLSPEVLVALSNMCMEPERVIAQAFEKLAVNSQKIGQLNITPDLLESVIGRANHS